MMTVSIIMIVKNLKLFISDVGNYEDGDREDMDTVMVITVLQPWR